MTSHDPINPEAPVTHTVVVVVVAGSPPSMNAFVCVRREREGKGSESSNVV